MKAQASFEYILIVGAVLFFIVSGSMIIYNYSSRANDESMKATINKAGNDIISSITDVYYIGENSWETVKVTLPSNVINVSVPNNYEIVIRYDSRGGINDAVFFSDINITTSSNTIANHSGLVILKAVSLGSSVNISEEG